MEYPSTEEQRRQFAERAMAAVLQHASQQAMQQRERIATACLAGLLAGAEVTLERVGDEIRFAPDADQSAALALAYADALMRRLALPPSTPQETPA